MAGGIVTEFAEGIWTVDGDPIRMLTIPFRVRSTVVKLRDGRLWLHSPVQPTPERFAAVESLGEVGHIVAPNKLHHLFAGPWAEHFHDAKLWGGPGLATRRPDLPFTAELDDDPPEAWRDDLAQVHFAGSKMLPEIVFFHSRSRTVIFTDIIQNHEPDADGWFFRTGKKLNGILAPDGGCPKDWRLTVRDKDAARRARDRILAWDFDRMIVTHGRCLTEGAHPFVERAFAWLERVGRAR